MLAYPGDLLLVFCLAYLNVTASLLCINSSVTKEDQEEETPNLASPQPTEEPPEPMASPESESSKESHTSDSDSDGPILYTDDDDDDDDNTSAESKTI